MRSVLQGTCKRQAYGPLLETRVDVREGPLLWARLKAAAETLCGSPERGPQQWCVVCVLLLPAESQAGPSAPCGHLLTARSLGG